MITEDKVTELFCIADDFCKEFNAEIKKKLFCHQMTARNAAFRYNSFRNFKHYYCQCVCKTWSHLFPGALSYNRFVELQPRCFVAMVMFLNLCCFGKCSGITFIDSTCIPVIHNKRQHSMRVFKGMATKGKSTMGWFEGFKLHLGCNEKGEILNFVVTKANVDDRNEDVIKVLTEKLFGKLYADKGYISANLFGQLWDDGVHIVTGIKSNMKNRLMPLYDKIMLRKRSVIESVNDMLMDHAGAIRAIMSFNPQSAIYRPRLTMSLLKD